MYIYIYTWMELVYSCCLYVFQMNDGWNCDCQHSCWTDVGDGHRHHHVLNKTRYDAFILLQLNVNWMLRYNYRPIWSLFADCCMHGLPIIAICLHVWLQWGPLYHGLIYSFRIYFLDVIAFTVISIQGNAVTMYRRQASVRVYSVAISTHWSGWK